MVSRLFYTNIYRNKQLERVVMILFIIPPFILYEFDDHFDLFWNSILSKLQRLTKRQPSAEYNFNRTYCIKVKFILIFVYCRILSRVIIYARRLKET